MSSAPSKCFDMYCERFFLDTPGLLCYSIDMISGVNGN